MVRVGDPIEIHCQGGSHVAHVRWHFDDTCGLMFEQPLSPRAIAAILGSRLLQ